MPELWKPTHENEKFLTFDGNLLALPTKRQHISNNLGLKQQSKDDKQALKVGGWFWSPYETHVKPRLLIEMVACGMQHFCCVSNVMYGSKLFTWGDNGADN